MAVVCRNQGIGILIAKIKDKRYFKRQQQQQKKKENSAEVREKRVTKVTKSKLRIFPGIFIFFFFIC